jgi:hypothetical protein
MPQAVQSGSEAKFSRFWCHYLQAHAHAGTRALHYIGTLVGLLSIIVAVFQTNPWIALAGVVAAYLLAWTGHFLIERNRPCVYAHPAWSFKGNLRMFGLWLKGRLDRELQTCGVSEDRQA